MSRTIGSIRAAVVPACSSKDHRSSPISPPIQDPSSHPAKLANSSTPRAGTAPNPVLAIAIAKGATSFMAAAEVTNAGKVLYVQSYTIRVAFSLSPAL